MSTTALATRAPQAMCLADMQTVAKTMAESGLFPAWNTPAKMLTLMLLCQSEGRDAITAVNRYDNIQGRVAKRPQAMLEDFLCAGGDVEWHQLTDKVAEATFTPPGGKPLRHAYTWEEAMRAGNNTKDNYRKYPMEMLRSRLIGRALRTVWPAATNAMYTPEELVAGEVNITPATVQQAQPVAMFQQSEPAAAQAVPVIEAELVEPEGAAAGEPAVLQQLRDLGEGKALAYLQSIGWLAAGAKLEDLGDVKLKQVAARFEAFAAKVEAHVAAQAEGGDK
jgi:hypothetical protein